MREENRGALWGPLALTAAVTAVVAALGPRHAYAVALATAGVLATGFAARAIVVTRDLVAPPGWPARRRVLAVMSTGLVLGVLAVVADAAPAARAVTPLAPLVLAAVGAQLFLAGAGTRPVGATMGRVRRALPVLGHALVLAGLAIPFARAPASGVAIGSGLALLALHAYWSHRLDAAKSTEAWDAVFLTALGAGVSGVLIVPFVTSDAAHVLVRFLAVAGLIGVLAALSRPPAAPAALSDHAGFAARMLAHGLAGVTLVNALVLALALLHAWSAQVAFTLLLAWLVVIASVEYGAVRYAARSRAPVTRENARVPEEVPLTVVVCARNDAGALTESVPENLRALPEHVGVLLVPARSSTDDTVAVAHALAREHADRVSVLEGTGGSKALDLNRAIEHVDDAIVLILDADETLTEAALAEGVRVLTEHPDAGVVQGRKVPRTGENGTALERFILTERRHSTGLDQTHHAHALEAAHFAGSAALVRRDAVRAVDGWSDWCLTEDIEFSLRLHLDGRWRILYAPGMIVRESPPADLAGLLKQRSRWARGWAQCCIRYLPRIARDRHRIGARRARGLAWVLFSAVSAPLATLLPALLVLRLTGFTPLLPVLVTLPVALIALPSRFVGFAYSAFKDPVIPEPDASPRRVLRLLAHAAGWIAIGWVIQLHALLQELSAAPNEWFVTRKARRVRVDAGVMHEATGTSPRIP